MKLLDRLLDLLYPPRCLICHEFLELGAGTVCAECIDTLPEFDGADPHVRFADRCVATFFYEEKLRDSFLRYKFGGRDCPKTVAISALKIPLTPLITERYCTPKRLLPFCLFNAA